MVWGRAAREEKPAAREGCRAVRASHARTRSVRPRAASENLERMDPLRHQAAREVERERDSAGRAATDVAQVPSFRVERSFETMWQETMPARRWECFLRPSARFGSISST